VDPALVARWRLANQLVAHPGGSAAAVVGRLAAVQAQDLLPSAWSLAQRAGGLTQRQVADELDAGGVLRTHVLRPTWHAVAPADIRWLLRATAPRVQRANAAFYRRLGLDDQVRAATRHALAAALADGRHRTRAELAAVLSEAGYALDGIALGVTIMDAELEGVVVSGVAAARQQTYALLDERAPADDGGTREEALAELARRYLATRGPASVEDLATWASLTLTEARAAVASVAGELERVERDGVVWWHAPGEPPAASTTPRIDLVQAYDELVISYLRTRDVVTDGVPLFSDAGGAPTHWVLADGRAVGRWAYRRDGRGVPTRVVVRPFRAWTAAERSAVGDAVDAFGRFVGADLAWSEAPA
jgi:hypothetical protein